MRKIFTLIIVTFSILKLYAQPICNEGGNLIIYSNYDGGILTINIDENIPDLRIGICTYEPIQVNFTGAFLGNVTQVLYAGFNSMQNNNNCNQGNFITSISGVSPSIIGIETYPPIGYDNPNGHPNMVGTGGNCSATEPTGGGNTPDQIVYYFQQNLGGNFRFHYTQYACWQTQTLAISAGGNCCVVPVDDNAPPIASFTASATQICAGSCVTFTNTSTNGPFTNVSWTFEGGVPSTSTSNSPQVCYENDGTYTVNLSVDNAAGNAVQTLEGFITVSNNQFTITISPPGPVSLCEGESITLTAQNGLSNYEWSNGQNSQQVEITETGGYSVSAENATGCIGVSNVVNVEITPIPVASFTFLQTFPEYLVEFTNTSTGNGTYVWNFPGGNTSNIENPEFQFPFDNNWPVTLIASNNCGADTLNTTVNVIKTGIVEVSSSEGFAFINDNLLLFSTEQFSGKQANVNIYSSLGQLLLNTELDIVGGSLNSLPIQELNAGIYFLKVVSGNKVWIKKTIKI
jgi:PKD repeat protein